MSRSAIGLWTTEGVIGALFLGLGRSAFLLVVPPTSGPMPLLRWLLPIAVGLYSVVSIGVRPR